MFDTYLGTMNGVYRLCDGATEPLGLASERIWAIHAWRDERGLTILAGSYGNGMYRSEDGGANWSPANDGLTASAFRYIGPDPLNASAILAGTEPGRIFRSKDDGMHWQELAGITHIAGYDEWFLPYSPRAGAVRNVYAPPGSTGRLFASVEVGGLLRSEDGGNTWACAQVIEDDDIHFISGHPDDPDLLYASLGYAALPQHRRDDGVRRFGGIARSRDGGQTWQKLESDYTRATIVPPTRHDLVLAGPSPQVGRGGRIVVSSDGGDTWEPASAGLDIPMEDMVEVFHPAPDGTVWAVSSGGRLLRATPGEWHWHTPVPADAALSVQSVAFVPDAA
jgi:photosystem II stability/assembly factor-like uncharacterized protein